MKPTPHQDPIDREKEKTPAKAARRDGSSPPDAKASKPTEKPLRSTPDEDTGPKGGGRLG